MDPKTQLFEGNILVAQINALNNQITESAFCFRSKIEKLTLIISGSNNDRPYCKIIDFKPPQKIPPEIYTLFKTYATRLIAERNNFQQQLDKLMQESGQPLAE